MFLAGIAFTGNRSFIGKTSTDRFYASKEIPMDHGKAKIVMATVRLDIETEAFQINMETNTLMIPRLGITQTINQTNQFTIKNAGYHNLQLGRYASRQLPPTQRRRRNNCHQT